MNLDTIRGALLWCSIINYGILVLWALLTFLPPLEGLRRLIGRLYRISPERFDELNYIGIASYKILILVFNIVPFIALTIVG